MREAHGSARRRRGVARAGRRARRFSPRARRPVSREGVPHRICRPAPPAPAARLIAWLSAPGLGGVTRAARGSPRSIRRRAPVPRSPGQRSGSGPPVSPATAGVFTPGPSLGGARSDPARRRGRAFPSRGPGSHLGERSVPPVLRDLPWHVDGFAFWRLRGGAVSSSPFAAGCRSCPAGSGGLHSSPRRRDTRLGPVQLVDTYRPPSSPQPSTQTEPRRPHPLAITRRWKHPIGAVGCGVVHAPRGTRGAEAAALAGERAP